MFEWIRRLVSDAARHPCNAQKSRRPRFRPQLEVLEGRIAPAGLVVETAADDGSAGSLRQVIANAPAGSTITFDPNVFPNGGGTTITLDPTRGPIPITANNLTIDGGSTSTVAISGGGNNRIFNILGGNLTETIQNVTLENGKASANDPNGGDGGAILDTSQAPLTLNYVDFANNNADWNGGAVYTQLGTNNTLTVANCLFRDNSALNANNPPTDPNSGFGGAIEAGGYQPGGETVDNNLSITNSNFGYNNAAGGGGAVYLDNEEGGTQLSVSSSGFQNNGALQSGGAIQTFGLTSIDKSTFQNNTAAYSGGGLFVGKPVLLSVTYSTFTDNTAQTNYGGAASCMSDATFLGDLFDDNQATGANGAGGGLAIFNQSTGVGLDTIDLFNDTFFKNFADGYGGGLYLYASSGANDQNVLTLTSLTVYQNSASTQGGGIYVDPSSIYGGNNTPPQLTNSIIAGNSIDNTPDDGPDIYGQIFTRSYNLVGIGDGATVTNNGGKWGGRDQVGTSAAPIDPGLDPNGLQNNGGSTLTIKPVGVSPALNKGNPTLVGQINGTQLDQRGYRRQLTPNIRVTIGAEDPNAKVVAAGQSSTSINSSTNPALAGQSVTFTAEVTTDAGTPTGTVTFEDGDTELGTVPLDDNGFASFTTSSLTLGSHDITAVYSGDDDSAGSSASLTQVISAENDSSVSLFSSTNPATLNQSVTFTATVSGNSGTPTGNVTFMDGDTVLGTAALDDTGTATFTTSALSLGDQTITAIYGGDATYGDSSAVLTQTVQQSVPFLSLSSNSMQTQPGQPVTFSASVSGSGGSTPTGSVTFLDGTTTLATVPLDSNGDASFTTSALSSGIHVITAIYSGDDTYAAASFSMLQTVGSSSLNDPVVFLTSSASSSLAGQSVTFTANVSGGGATPTGTVTFLDGTTVLDTATLDGNGNATFTTADLSLGSHDILAIYSGDSNYCGNASSLTQSIVQAGSTTSLASSANPSPSGQPVTFTATVAATDANDGTPSGTVAFYDGTTFLGTGTLALENGQWQASFTTAALGLGTHNIIAIYSGDGTFAESESSLVQTISS